MAEDGTALPYYNSNPSGIGNAVLGKPVDLLAAQDENDVANSQSVDAIIKQRQQKIKQQQDNAQYLTGLNPDLKGIMEEDTPYFQKKSQDILDLGKKAVAAGGDIRNPQNPYYWQIQQAVNGLNAEVEMSKGQKTSLMAEAAKWLAKPDDYDNDATKANMTSYRMSGNPIERNKQSVSGLLVNQPPDVFGALDKEIASAKTDKEKYIGPVSFPSGQSGLEYEKGLQPDQIDAIGNHIYSNQKYKPGLQKIWDGLTPADMAAFNLSAQIETAKNKAQGINSVGDPLKYMVLDQAKKRAGQIEKDFKNVQFNPALSAIGRYQLEHPADDDTWKKRYGLTTGDPQFYDSEVPPALTEQPIINGGVNVPVIGGTANFSKDYYSDFDHGTPMGSFAMDVPKVMDGQVVNDANGHPIMTKVMGVPNTIVAHRTFNGKPYIQTTESQYAYSRDVKKTLDDISPSELLYDQRAWFPETSGTPRQIINAKTDKEKDELRKQHNDFVNKQGAFTSTGDVDNYRASGATRPVQQTPTNTTYVTNDGKPVKDIDKLTPQQLQQLIDKKVIKAQ